MHPPREVKTSRAKSRRRAAGLLAAAACLLLAGLPAGAQPEPRRVVVTFDGRLEAAPALAAADFEGEAGGRILRPTRVYGPAELPTLVAVVLDARPSSALAAQLPALRAFLRRQPPKTYVGIFYLAGRSAQAGILFDSDLTKVEEALVLPTAEPVVDPAAGLGQVIEYMGKLPPARKEVLLVSDGSSIAAAERLSDWKSRLRLAQQTGIPVWVIPFVGETRPLGPPPGMSPDDIRAAATENEQGANSYRRATAIEEYACDFLTPRGQERLAALGSLSRGSGGKLFAGGAPAADLRPLLEEFDQLLARQWVLEFATAEPPQRIRVLRKVEGAKLLYPRY